MGIKINKITKVERDKLQHKKLVEARKEAEATAKVVHDPLDLEVTVVELPPKPEPVLTKTIDEAHEKAKETTWRRPASEWLRVKKSEYVEQLIKQEN